MTEARFDERVRALIAGEHADDRDIWTILEDCAAARPTTRFHYSYLGKLTSFTALELRDQAHALAASLAELGLARGDRLVMQLPNCSQSAVTFLATAALGAICIPLAPFSGSAELSHVIANSGAKILVGPRHWHKLDFDARIRGLDRAVSVRHLVMVDGLASKLDGVHDWETLASAPGEAWDPTVVPPDDACMILYTSGTTSAPKGVRHSHRTLVSDCWQSWVLLKHLKNRTLFAGAPAGHIGPVLMLIRQLLYGIDGIYLDRWDSGAATDLISRFSAGWSIGVPFHLNSLLPEARSGRIPSLEMFLVGGANVSNALVESANAAGIVACRSYGSTENPTVAQCSIDTPLEIRTRTDGFPMPGVHLRIVGDDGSQVEPGQVGEVLVRGPETFLGYIDQDLNKEAFTEDQWFRTGDLGMIDGDGALTITGRKKDIIIRGGENISAKEVEDLLSTYGPILEAAVVGQPDELMGERLCAFVVLQPDCSLSLAELENYFRLRNVSRHKTPEKLFVIPEFPRNESGKVLKGELRKMTLEDYPSTGNL
jgi:acyl-CoA synthetase (AMP-forming)/AMP-acid ligase II